MARRTDALDGGVNPQPQQNSGIGRRTARRALVRLDAVIQRLDLQILDKRPNHAGLMIVRQQSFEIKHIKPRLRTIRPYNSRLAHRRFAPPRSDTESQPSGISNSFTRSFAGMTDEEPTQPSPSNSRFASSSGASRSSLIRVTVRKPDGFLGVVARRGANRIRTPSFAMRISRLLTASFHQRSQPCLRIGKVKAVLHWPNLRFEGARVRFPALTALAFVARARYD